MRNWLGQEIVEGSVVGRGSRSDLKIGVVSGVDTDIGKARVAWKFGLGRHWFRNPIDPREDLDISGATRITSAGSPYINTLFLLSDTELRYAEAFVSLIERADAQQMSELQLQQELEQL